MTANQLLISVIGLFSVVMGIIYVFHLRGKHEVEKKEKLASWSLIGFGIVIGLLPFIGSFDFSGYKEKSKPTSLMGEKAFQSVVLDDPANYDKAARIYEKGARLWNVEQSRYDSVEKVLEYFNGSIKLFETAEALTARGQALVQANQMEKAMLDYNRAIELKPEFGNAYFNRAALYYIFGDKTRSCEDWKKAAEFNVAGAEDLLYTMCH